MEREVFFGFLPPRMGKEAVRNYCFPELNNCFQAEFGTQHPGQDGGRALAAAPGLAKLGGIGLKRR